MRLVWNDLATINSPESAAAGGQIGPAQQPPTSVAFAPDGQHLRPVQTPCSTTSVLHEQKVRLNIPCLLSMTTHR